MKMELIEKKTKLEKVGTKCRNKMRNQNYQEDEKKNEISTYD